MAKSQSFMALLLFSLVLGFGVNGMVNSDDTKLDPDSILKTIVVGNETIDCVDILKQPAFKHPLLKNHTLQLKPSSHPIGSKSIIPINSMKATQMWHRNGEYCPKGTVPILRSSTANILPKNTYHRLSNTNSDWIPHPEVASAYTQGFDYYGINADLSVWNPSVNPHESSSSQVWVTDDGGDTTEAIEAGWVVTAKKPHPSFFAYWTVDGYGKSGCYNLDCPGFIVTSYKFSLGGEINSVSVYGKEQFSTNFKIHKDLKTSNWWLTIQGVEIGYWPGELFTKLKGTAQLLEWGGKIINTEPQGIHTTTQMGSGHFPSEGYGKAAWVHNLEFVDGFGFFNPVTDIIGQATRHECYDVKVLDWNKHLGATFLYGGPGFSLRCRGINKAGLAITNL